MLILTALVLSGTQKRVIHPTKTEVLKAYKSPPPKLALSGGFFLFYSPPVVKLISLTVFHVTLCDVWHSPAASIWRAKEKRLCHIPGCGRCFLCVFFVFFLTNRHKHSKRLVNYNRLSFNYFLKAVRRRKCCALPLAHTLICSGQQTTSGWDMRSV